MCGFSVVLQLGSAAFDLAAVVEGMSRAIAHRGQDDAGAHVAGPVGMGFRRLSILDLSPSGHQPMSIEDGDLTLVFNGEIYNYVELREELVRLGHHFKSTGDTEVLLRAYRQWGADCVSRLNGMWAFVIHDRARGKLFGSRDRFGIKPLYVHRRPDCLLFASEIKAIRDSGLWSGGTNWPVAADFLIRGRLDAGRETFYAGIEQIGPATAFEIGFDGAFREWRYWRIEDVPPLDESDPATAFAELFEDAMRLHMRSDVPVGVHLSGGLDSTSIICVTARLRHAQGAAGPLLAFCYQAAEFDESALIADTVRQTGATLANLETSPRAVWDDLPAVLRCQDEPVHSMTAVIGYQLMRLTAQHGLKVILNGQGADETLAGYPSYFRDYWQTLLCAGRIGELAREIDGYTAVHGGGRGALLKRQLRHFLQGELRRIGAYRRLSQWSEHRRARQDDWFTPGLSDHLLPLPLPMRGGAATLDQSLATSIRRDPLPLYLRVEDRNSMAHSLEARVPFLDYRLVELAHRLPANWKMRGPWNKFILREAMRGRIPESVRARPVKMGFPVPVAKWLAGPLYEAVRDQLTSRSARERGVYDVSKVLRDLERTRQGELDASVGLVRIAQFELWSDFATGASAAGSQTSSGNPSPMAVA